MRVEVAKFTSFHCRPASSPRRNPVDMASQTSKRSRGASAACSSLNCSGSRTSGIRSRRSPWRTPAPRTGPEIGFRSAISHRMPWLKRRQNVFRIFDLEPLDKGKLRNQHSTLTVRTSETGTSFQWRRIHRLRTETQRFRVEGALPSSPLASNSYLQKCRTRSPTVTIVGPRSFPASLKLILNLSFLRLYLASVCFRSCAGLPTFGKGWAHL